MSINGGETGCVPLGQFCSVIHIRPQKPKAAIYVWYYLVAKLAEHSCGRKPNESLTTKFMPKVRGTFCSTLSFTIKKTLCPLLRNHLPVCIPYDCSGMIRLLSPRTHSTRERDEWSTMTMKLGFAGNHT